MDNVWLNLQFLVRWLHVIAGITWIGHLYFFNFVNGPLQAKLDGPTKKVLNPQLMPRALFWFRWGAMITLLAGLYLFWSIYFSGTSGYGVGSTVNLINESGLTVRAMWIMFGMLLGIIMWFNVWFIIWPAQKIIQAAVRDGTPPDAALAKRATNASKFNTYASGPMLFGMLGANHANYAAGHVLMAASIVLGLFAIYHAYKGAATAASDFATAGQKPAEAPPTEAKK